MECAAMIGCARSARSPLVLSPDCVVLVVDTEWLEIMQEQRQVTELVSAALVVVNVSPAVERFNVERVYVQRVNVECGRNSRNGCPALEHQGRERSASVVVVVKIKRFERQR